MSETDRVRSIRLEALADPVAAIAFLETREQAEERADGFWQERTIGAALSDDAAQFVAELGRDWVGTVSVLVPDHESTGSFGRASTPGCALLVAVYVRPSHRGRGILDSLVDAAAEWARDRGLTDLALDVHDENVTAQRAYARLGFVATGGTWKGPNGLEHEMVRSL